MKSKKEEKDITRTCRVVLEGGGVRLPVGEFTVTKPEPGPTPPDFADMAFRSASASLNKLMVPLYRLIVIDGEREDAYGLDRWVKLFDKSSPEYMPRGKQSVRKKATA